MQTSRALWASLIVFLILLIGLLGFGFFLTAPYLLDAFIGGILAVLLFPIFRRLRAHKVTEKWAALIVVVGLLLLILGPLSLFGTIIVRQGIGLAQKISSQDFFSAESLASRISNLKFAE